MSGAIVYGVSCGAYSDYEICRIFATKGEAEQWHKKQEHTCKRCRGTGEITAGWTMLRGVIRSDVFECARCQGTGVANDYDIEDFPFGPEENDK